MTSTPWRKCRENATATGSTVGGLLPGTNFGLGAIVIPALVFGVDLTYFGARLCVQLQSWRTVIERVSARLSVVVGIGNRTRW